MNIEKLKEFIKNNLKIQEENFKRYDDAHKTNKSKETYGTSRFYLGKEQALEEVLKEIEKYDDKKAFIEKVNGRRYDELDIMTKLEYAKWAVRDCLESQSTLIDWKGLVYWAQEVERLKGEIRDML